MTTKTTPHLRTRSSPWPSDWESKPTANYCRVIGTPEELIVDFGLNSQPVGVPSEPLVITQRIIVRATAASKLVGNGKTAL